MKKNNIPQEKIAYLVTILAVVAFISVSIAIGALYFVSFEQQKLRLIDTAQIQARLIEAVVRFDAQHSELDHPEGAFGATLSQIIDAQKNYKGFGNTGEFCMANLEDDKIVFLLRHRHMVTGDGIQSGAPIIMSGKLAEPMQQAISGKSGVMEGLDYRGEKVLAAFEPVVWPGKTIGVVAKIDISEIRAPFVNAMLISGICAIVVVAFGATLIRKIGGQLTRPLIVDQEASNYQSILSPNAVPDDLMKEEKIGALLLLGYAGLAAGIFLMDVMFPLGVAGGVPYVALVLVSMWSPNRSVIFIIAAIASILTILGFFFSPSGGEMWIVLTNRFLALFAIWITALLIGRFKMEESKVRISEESLARAQQTAHLGNWSWDILRSKVFWSDEIYRILGFTPQEFEATYETFINSVRPEEKEFVEKSVNDALENVKPYEIDRRAVLPDGSERIVHEKGKVTFDGHGKPIFIEGTMQDITEQKKILAKLAKANEEIKSFANIVSHDLRSPLVNLKGFSQELKSVCEDMYKILKEVSPHFTEDQRKRIKNLFQENMPEALGFIESSTSTMDRLVSNILTLSRTGRRELHFEEIKTDKLVEEKIKILQHQIAKKGIKIKLNKLPNVQADESALDQIFGNILSNAVHYLDPHRTGEIEISGEQHLGKTEFKVRDNGRGIAEEDFHKVFELFRRVGKPDVPGDGMGLPFAKTLIERHCGEIWFESQEGVGTTFYFTISGRDGGQRTDDS